MSEDASQRLDELKLLWESDPSSKVYLQLASVYRQKGQLDKAVEVLETSLQHRPRDPRGRVALARCKMELKDHGAAADLLEGVIRQDAAHMEANKQLLECYLQIGDAEKAEERLNIYRLINDRDPELDHLEYRLTSLLDGEDDGSSAAVEGTAAEVKVPDVPETTAPEPAAAAEPAEPTAPPAEPEPEPEPVSEAAKPQAEPATPVISTTMAKDEESVGAPHPAEPAVPEVAAPEPSEPEFAAPEPAAPEVAAPEPDPVEAAESAADPPAEPTDDLFELAPAPAADDDPWSGDLFDLAAPSSPAPTAEPDLGGLWEQTEIVDLDDDADHETDAAAAGVAEPEDDSPEVDAGDVEVDEDGEADDDSEAASATLGLMYLKQGHLDEAEGILKKVLARDANNEAALAGLAQLETLRHAASPDATDIEESVEEPAEDGDETEAPAAQKAEFQAEEAQAEPPPAEARPEEATPAAVAEEPQVEAAEPAPEPDEEASIEEAPVEEAPVEEEPPVEPAPALTAQALLGRVASEGTLPADATGRKIVVLRQYIQQIRTASGDHVH